MSRDIDELASLSSDLPGVPANHETLARRSSRDTEGDVQRVLAKMEANHLDLTLVRVLANSPQFFRPYIVFSDVLMNRSVISRPLRETVILAMAARTTTQYEWAEHVPMARDAGLTDQQIESLTVRPLDPALFSREQVLAVAVADDLLERRGVQHEHWAEMVARWGETGALELVAIVGWWGAFVQVMLNALGLVRPDVEGWAPS